MSPPTPEEPHTAAVGGVTVKRAARRLAVEALERTGVLPRLRGRADPERAVILRYHSVSEFTPESDAYRSPSIAVRPDTFARQMRFVAANYQVVSLTMLVERLARNERFPERAVAITFDDGYRDNHRYALPVLRDLRLPATVYVTTDAIGNGWRFWVSRLRFALLHTTRSRVEIEGWGTFSTGSARARSDAIGELTLRIKALDVVQREQALVAILASCGVEAEPAAARGWMMDWSELRELQAAGLEIGAHTCSHPILTRLSSDAAAHEIRESRRILEEGCGKPVRHFAYPNGGGVVNHDAQVAELVRNAGFLSAVTSVNDVTRIGDDPFRLRRIGVSERHALDGLALNLERDRLTPRRRTKPVERPRLLLVGPPAIELGGIATCVAGIRRSRVAETFRVEHVSATGERAHYELGTMRKAAAALRAFGNFAKRLVRRPALVQVHVSHYGDFWRNAPFVLTAAVRGIPTVMMIHGSRFDSFYADSGPLARFGIRMLLRRTAAVLVRGSYWRDCVSAITPVRRIEIVRTTTEPVAEVGGERELLVLFVGNGSAKDAERKGLGELLAAIPAVLAEFPETRFRIVGPRLEPPWSERLAGTGHADRVEFVGPLLRRQLADEYARARILTLPSRAEGMPNVVLEAMAHGLAVVATDVGSMAEVLEHERGGLLVPVGDVDALVRALLKLLGDPGMCRTMGERNRARVRDEFSDRRTSERLLALYADLLEPRRVGGPTSP